MNMALQRIATDFTVLNLFDFEIILFAENVVKV